MLEADQGEFHPAINSDGITAYHAAYFAHELSRKAASDDPDKLGASLMSAGIDLNPHQIDAALFAFRSPLSRGAILADEVGLGKTIEAGLIISQLWAEKKQRILIICPTMIRKQWVQELKDKFSISATILDTRSYNAAIKQGENPFEPESQAIVCTYHFASAKHVELMNVFWDLVVIDEAHRLRNVWKNSSGIAAKIQQAVQNRPLIMLTATPLQNTLLELFGLVSFIDEQMFGSIEAFRARYMRGAPEEREFADLRERLRPICLRTLRRQVQEYVRFTNRIPLTQAFEPHEDEQQLYDRVSEYLQRDEIIAIPYKQRQLLILVLRKILASSSFAIANTLETLINRVATQHGDALEQLEEDIETVSESADEWSEDDDGFSGPYDEPNPGAVRREIEELTEYMELAKSIKTNAKGTALLTALDKGFEKLKELHANRKAVIFTESKRTQAYLAELLKANGYEGKIVLLSGSSSDPESNEIYREWVERHQDSPLRTGNKAVDFRSALVERFRDHAEILISTEAGAEGLNLQFCSLVVNYDLPWNPQRIEQRIGRCHRYGQKHDVVVVNFLNQKNAADLRVFQLLSEKFHLFEGVFGASDQVLGALESGVDFEKRILNIYQKCRTKQDIDDAFDQLKLDLEEQITEKMTEANRKLIEHFDEEVRGRIKLTGEQAKSRLTSISRMLWHLTKFELEGRAAFDEETHEFTLSSTGELPQGPYQLAHSDGSDPDAIRYSPTTPLAEVIIGDAIARELDAAEVVFDYTNTPAKAGILEPYLGKSGWLLFSVLTVESEKDREERLLMAVVDEQGKPLDDEIGAKLFTQRSLAVGETTVDDDTRSVLESRSEYLTNATLEEIAQRNQQFFLQELEKLERWAEDLKHGLEYEIKEMDRQIKETAREIKLAPTLNEKVELSRHKTRLESDRMKKRRQLFEAQDQIDAKKNALLDEIEAKLRTRMEKQDRFVVRWTLQ